MRTKSEARRQAILESAAKVFQETGFERASMGEICERLGYSKATLYSYFKSKDELFVEVMMAASEAEFEATHQALAGSPADIRQALEHFGVRFIHFIYSPAVQAVRRLVVSEAGRGELGRHCYEKGPALAEAEVARHLAQAMTAGQLRPADPQVASHHLRALLEAEWLDRFMFQLLGDISKADVRRSVTRAVEVFMAAYGPLPETADRG